MSVNMVLYKNYVFYIIKNFEKIFIKVLTLFIINAILNTDQRKINKKGVIYMIICTTIRSYIVTIIKLFNLAIQEKIQEHYNKED